MSDYPLGVLIKHIQIQISKSLNHRLEQMNLTGSQAHVLVFLMHRTGQRTTLRDLEEYLHQSHVTVTGLVQRLVQILLTREETLSMRNTLRGCLFYTRSLSADAIALYDVL